MTSQVSTPVDPASRGVTSRSGSAFTVMPDQPDRYEWERYALCAQTDPESFFPEKGQTSRHAKAICARCDVRAECLEDALNDPRDTYGIRAGLSVPERRRLRKAREVAA